MAKEKQIPGWLENAIVLERTDPKTLSVVLKRFRDAELTWEMRDGGKFSGRVFNLSQNEKDNLDIGVVGHGSVKYSDIRSIKTEKGFDLMIPRQLVDAEVPEIWDLRAHALAEREKARKSMQGGVIVHTSNSDYMNYIESQVRAIEMGNEKKFTLPSREHMNNVALCFAGGFRHKPQHKPFHEDPMNFYQYVYDVAKMYHAPYITAGADSLLRHTESGTRIFFLNRDAKICEIASKELVRGGSYPHIKEDDIRTLTISRSHEMDEKAYKYLVDRGIGFDEYGQPTPIALVDTGKNARVIRAIESLIRRFEGDKRVIKKYLYVYNGQQEDVGEQVQALLALKDGKNVEGLQCSQRAYASFSEWIDDIEGVPLPVEYTDRSFEEYQGEDGKKHYRPKLKGKPVNALAWNVAKEAVRRVAALGQNSVRGIYYELN
jgi:hypothetical protein